MDEWFSKKNKLERLQEKYRLLMRRSFEVAAKDKKSSDDIHKQALEIKKEISILRCKE
ncbi:MAG TPA: Lacal_2735 family protein [Flavobacteriaceae bacterium]|nr:Lacal_2735 family protein [Flavobacteriaceae bacterium]